MIYDVPKLEQADLEVIQLIEQQKQRLRIFTQNNPNRWMGSLRRSTFARAMVGSNSIEGYHATVGDAIAVVQNEQPLDAKGETHAALQGYRDAMTYIIQAASDPHFEFASQFLKSLQFMMLRHDLTKNPGQWRPGAVYVVEQSTGKAVYEPPDAEHVNGLIEELLVFLRSDGGTPPIVRAAMAHLNLTMIHPFKDGNGRMARGLQTLVLALEGVIHPVFSSIEEWLGNHTPEYYRILADTGQGKWNPSRDALPWIRFCLTAHYQQSATLIRRNEEYSRLYEKIVDLVSASRLPDRVTLPVFDAALGWPITNPRYRTDAEVGEYMATRDLKALCNAGLFEPIGEKRGRYYKRTAVLEQLRNSVRMRKPLENPYELVPSKTQYQLPFGERRT
jgi:Fic family protein